MSIHYDYCITMCVCLIYLRNRRIGLFKKLSQTHNRNYEKFSNVHGRNNTRSIKTKTIAKANNGESIEFYYCSI